MRWAWLGASITTRLADTRSRVDELLSAYEAADLDELAERHRRAGDLRARLEAQPACSPERLAELRAACSDPASVEALGGELEQLLQESPEEAVRTLHAELERLATEQGITTSAPVEARLATARARLTALEGLLESGGGDDSAYERALVAQ